MRTQRSVSRQNSPVLGRKRAGRCSNFYPAAIGSLAVGDALRAVMAAVCEAERVSGAERSGPPCCGVAGWAYPAEPRVRSVL